MVAVVPETASGGEPSFVAHTGESAAGTVGAGGAGRGRGDAKGPFDAARRLIDEALNGEQGTTGTSGKLGEALALNAAIDWLSRPIVAEPSSTAPKPAAVGLRPAIVQGTPGGS